MPTDGLAITERILGKDFPDPARLEKELETIETLLRQGKSGKFLERRLDNLRTRLCHPRPVSAQRQRNLTERLRQAVDREVLRLLLVEITIEKRLLLQRWLDSTSIPDWLQSPRASRVVRGILSLKPRFRSLGLRCLRGLLDGDIEWTVREPSNIGFIRLLQGKGISPQPWVWPAAPRRVPINGKGALWLGLETNPFEIMCMGLYFDTCLSPDGCNFYSAVANAVDINKRVLFARDDSGRVLGRCLMAIGVEGTIVTFDTYCHDNELEFDKIAGTFVSEIAAEMGTVVDNNTDRIPALVAPRWYNDGPVDLVYAVTDRV